MEEDDLAVFEEPTDKKEKQNTENRHERDAVMDNSKSKIAAIAHFLSNPNSTVSHVYAWVSSFFVLISGTEIQ